MDQRGSVGSRRRRNHRHRVRLRLGVLNRHGNHWLGAGDAVAWGLPDITIAEVEDLNYWDGPGATGESNVRDVPSSPTAERARNGGRTRTSGMSRLPWNFGGGPVEQRRNDLEDVESRAVEGRRRLGGRVLGLDGKQEDALFLGEYVLGGELGLHGAIQMERASEVRRGERSDGGSRVVQVSMTWSQARSMAAAQRWPGTPGTGGVRSQTAWSTSARFQAEPVAESCSMTSLTVGGSGVRR